MKPIQEALPLPARINPGNRKSRAGFMTTAVCEAVEIALFHPTLYGLEVAFNNLTQGRIQFDRSKVNEVELRKLPSRIS